MKYPSLDPKELVRRLEQAEKLLDSDSTTKQKFLSLTKIIKGINPALDKKLSSITKTLNTLEKIQKGRVIELTAENLPTDTPQRKKRKKFLLLFIKQWKGLKSEVRRVKKELRKQSIQNEHASTAGKARAGGKLLATAKGPLGALTAIAAVIAGGIIFLDAKSVSVTLTNINCQSINPVGYRIDLPGIKLPHEPIPPGGSASMTLPPLRLSVDARSPDTIRMTSFRMNVNFDRPGVGGDILFNGTSLLDRQTEVDLGSRTSHTITVICR